MTLAQTRRYEEAVTRNLRNFSNRFYGVNKAADNSAATSDLRNSMVKYDLRGLKIHLGVRDHDDRFNAQIQTMLDKVPSKKMKDPVKAPVEETKVEAASHTPDERAPLPAQKKPKFKKGPPKA